MSDLAPFLIIGAGLAWLACGMIAVKIEDDGSASSAPIAQAYLETCRMATGPVALFAALRNRRKH